MATPQRMCAGCRAREDRNSLIRLVWAEGLVVVDERRRLPGRGVSLHAACIDRALRSKAIGRGLRRSVDPVQVAAVLDGLRPRSA